MKLDKLFVVCFFRFFGLDPAQNTIVVYSVLRNQPIETCWLRNLCIVYESKTKDCALSWIRPNINLGIFVCSFDVFQAS